MMFGSVRPFLLKEGDLVPGFPYRLVKKLGQGAFGQVWKARHETLREFYALKFCLHEQALITLRNEAKHLHRIQKEGPFEGFVALRQIYDSPDRQYPFVEYECIEGEDFEKLLERRFEEEGPFTPFEAAEVIYELASIMARVHALKNPIVHRDLKPSNIMVVHGQPPWQFRVADFGLGVLAITASRAEELSLSDEGRKLAVSGTVCYMSHEQRDPDHVGHPSDDVHALGVMWYELLMGELYVFGWSPPSHCRHFDWAQLQEELLETGLKDKEAKLLVSCLKRNTHRPQNAQVLARELKQLHPELQKKTTKEKVAERLVDDAAQRLDCRPYLARALLENCENVDEEYQTGLQESISDCSSAIELDPENAEAHRIRGQALAEAGDYASAVADFTEAIRLNPTDERAYLDRADAYAIMEEEEKGETEERCDFQRAIADCCTAIRVSPKNTQCYRARAKLYECSGDHDKAFADYARIIRLDPQDSSVHLARAELYERRDDYEQAIAAYSEAVRLKNGHAYRARGELHEKLGNYDEAIADYTEYLRLDPENPWAISMRGYLYEKKGDYDRAIADYTEMIRLIPTAPVGYLRRADAYEKKGERRKAVADRQQAERLTR